MRHGSLKQGTISQNRGLLVTSSVTFQHSTDTAQVNNTSAGTMNNTTDSSFRVTRGGSMIMRHGSLKQGTISQNRGLLVTSSATFQHNIDTTQEINTSTGSSSKTTGSSNSMGNQKQGTISQNRGLMATQR
jgi:hypothetical protein